MPGVAVGAVTGYGFFLAPLAFTVGFFAGRSETWRGWALGVFTAITLALVFGLGYAYRDDTLWFFALYGASGLLALVAVFKLGTVARVRRRGLAGIVSRVRPVFMWSAALLAAALVAAAIIWASTQ